MDETERQSADRAKDAQGWDTARTLAEALPYIQIYDRKTVVIKYGGHAMGESAVARQFAADVVLLFDDATYFLHRHRVGEFGHRHS